MIEEWFYKMFGEDLGTAVMIVIGICLVVILIVLTARICMEIFDA